MTTWKHQGRGKARAARIDLGLALARRHARFDHPLPLEFIAPFCGCSCMALFRVEQKALRKLRKVIRRRLGLDGRHWAEALDLRDVL